MMKPTKMRNQMIYRASYAVRSAQVSSSLSTDLRGRYGIRSVRVVEGDTVRVVRGEYKGITAKVSRVHVAASRVAIEGTQREKTKGGKFDVLIHTSNLVVTDLNGEDGRRMKKIKGSKGESRQAGGAGTGVGEGAKTGSDVPKTGGSGDGPGMQGVSTAAASTAASDDGDVGAGAHDGRPDAAAGQAGHDGDDDGSSGGWIRGGGDAGSGGGSQARDGDGAGGVEEAGTAENGDGAGGVEEAGTAEEAKGQDTKSSEEGERHG